MPQYLKYILFFVLLISYDATAQNIVPNGDFEDYTRSAILSNLEYCVGWDNPTFGTPDYFQKATSDPMVNIPLNWFGFQNPHSGNAYIGIHLYDERWVDGNREYARQKLTQPIELGERYRVEYWVSMGDSSKTYGTPPQIAFYPFKDNASGYPIITEPQVYSTQTIFDATKWVKISKDIVADGNYTHVVIGNFLYVGDQRFYFESDVLPMGKRKLDFYIDDVSIIKLPPPFPDLGPDITMCDNEVRTISFNSEGYNYLWSTGETSKSIQVTKAGKYFLTIERKGLINSDTIIVTTIPSPKINLGLDTGICTSDSINITLTSEEGSYFHWKPSDLTTQSIQVNDYGTYSVHSLLENGCSSDDSIRIYNNCPPCFSELNVFPNPVKELLQMSFIYNYDKRHVKYRLINDIGQVVLSDYIDLKKGLNKLKVELPILNTGLYFLEMNIECGRMRYPLMVKQSD